MSVSIHPAVDGGVTAGSASFTGGTLVCKCTDRPVKVKFSSQVLHNHACGCSKCWKPAGAKFSVVAVVPSDQVAVLENGDKLAPLLRPLPPSLPRPTACCQPNATGTGRTAHPTHLPAPCGASG